MLEQQPLVSIWKQPPLWGGGKDQGVCSLSLLYSQEPRHVLREIRVIQLSRTQGLNAQEAPHPGSPCPMGGRENIPKLNSVLPCWATGRKPPEETGGVRSNTGRPLPPDDAKAGRGGSTTRHRALFCPWGCPYFVFSLRKPRRVTLLGMVTFPRVS